MAGRIAETFCRLRQSRLAEHASALELRGHMHGSNPVYKKLWFLLDKVSKQLRRAEEELLIRASARDRPHVRGRRDAIGITGTNGWPHAQAGNI